MRTQHAPGHRYVKELPTTAPPPPLPYIPRQTASLAVALCPLAGQASAPHTPSFFMPEIILIVDLIIFERRLSPQDAWNGMT